MTNHLSHPRYLRDRMVRRVPTATELASRSPFVVTQRDRVVLQAIEAHGFLTAELIELAFFPPPVAARHASCPQTYRRLRLLWLWAYVERIELPVARAFGGSRPYLYSLGPRGVALLASDPEREGTPPRQRRLDRLQELFLDHHLQVATFWALLQAQVRAGRFGDCRWTPERALRARLVRVVDPHTGRALPVLPDGFAELDLASGERRCCVVEIDMGTLTHERLRQKLRALDLYQASGLCRAHWGCDQFDTLLVTSSRARLEQVWKQGRKDVAQARWDRFALTTFDTLTRERFGRADVWLTLAGTYTGLPLQTREAVTRTASPLRAAR